MRIKGKITSWNDNKGFGFITPFKGGKQLFVHIKAFNHRNSRPVIGDIVTYAISSDKQGRPCAINATLAGENFAPPRNKKAGSLHIFISAAFLLIVLLSVLLTKLPAIIFAFYLIASLITYVVYAIDKKAAQKGNWRTQESTLHTLAIIGGWPGALIAQQTLRHKSKKESFRAVFWVTVFVNFGAFLWLFTPTGSSVLKTILSSI